MKKVKLKLDYGAAEAICFEVKKSIEFHKGVLIPLDAMMMQSLLEEVYLLLAAKTLQKYERQRQYTMTCSCAIALRMLLHSKIPPAEQVYKYELYNSTVTFIDKSIK